MSNADGNVIVFPVGLSRKAFARKARASKKETAAPSTLKVAAESLPVTASNGCLRKERREVWWMAEAAMRYWRTRLDFEEAVGWAQRIGIPEGRSHLTVEAAARIPLVREWREALVMQLLTPAWDANSVKWTQTTFASGQHTHTDTNPKKIEQAIADDLAWLAAHPTRRSNSEAMAKRREFNEAMRRRIRDFAASRGLSAEEIKPALKLKHEEIARFSLTHGVNIGWLLEGTGPISLA
jgi:hypothetical protein